jgi:hypothetical protein
MGGSLAKPDLFLDQVQGAMTFKPVPEAARAGQVTTIGDLDPGARIVDLGPRKTVESLSPRRHHASVVTER